MQLNEEIWGEINATPKLPEEVKKSLHVRIMRLIEADQAKGSIKRHLGATFMTQEASLAADKVAQNRNNPPLAGDAKPKSV